jgi:integrase
MRKLLTDSYCKAVAPPVEGRLDVADLRCAGLSFRVTPNGARSWTFRFRDPTTGASSRATIGNFPDVGLADARARANQMRATVAAGNNPIDAKRAKRATANQRSFVTIAERYMTEHSRRKKKSWGDDERNLRLHLLPQWKTRQIDQIRRADVIELVEGLVQNGTHFLANHVHALISSIFSFAVDADLVEANPCARLRKRGIEQASTRVLSDPEIRLFWSNVIFSPVSRAVGLALRLQLLTGTRPGEIVKLHCDELDSLEKPDKASWTLPASRTKNSREHFIPLSIEAVEIIKEARGLNSGQYLFPSPRGDAAVASHALAVAMRRLGESQSLNGAASDTWRANLPTPHDLRRTFATRLSELGVPKEDRDACLNHTPQGVGSRHYDRYQRAREKRAAFNLFAQSISTLLSNGARYEGT